VKRTTFRLAVAGASLAALAASLVLATSANASGAIEIPAGATATLSNAAFGDGGATNCPSDTLTYGYQLSGGALVPLATGGNGCNAATGATIGPFVTDMSLLIYLTDDYCGAAATYYSDGSGDADHALVTTESGGSYGVSITDCDVGSQTTTDRVPTDGHGNFNVTVTVVPAAQAPGVSIVTPPDGAFYSAGQNVLADFSCSDGTGGPGLLSSGGCVGTVADGSAIDTSSLGSHSFTVTATSQDTQRTTDTVNYTVAAPPTASISDPTTGGIYARNASIPTTFSCAEGTDGEGLLPSGGCVDNNGGSGTSGTLNTSSSGAGQAYSVTATSSDGQTTTTTIHYTVVNGPPTASITAPPDGQTYTRNQTVATSFSCDDPQGPGISSCVDNNGGSGTSGTLNTSSSGAGQAYSVTATSSDGQTTTTTIHYTVIGPPTASITAPPNNQSYILNQTVPTSFSCSDAVSPPGPGIASCTDSNAATSPGALNTSTAGPHAYTVTAISSDGESATATIDYTVSYVNPTNTLLPAISGVAQQNQTLDATTGTWSGDPAPTYTYQWQRCTSSCADISGATASSYVVSVDDVGYTLDVVVTATNAGDAVAATSDPTATVLTAAPANQGLPQIIGTAQENQTLSATQGSWLNSPDSYAYQWLRCDSTGASCSTISGAQTNSYTPASGDVGHTLSVVVTATNAGGHAAVTSPPTGVVSVGVPVLSELPAISGTAEQGKTLSTDGGSWTNAPSSFTYQWLACDQTGAGCTQISGATASSYVPAASDVGHTLRVAVVAINSSGNASATSAQSAVVLIAPPANSAPPAVSGAPVQAQALSASTGNWLNSPTTYTYQWLSCDSTGANCTPIPGAMASSYVPLPGDAGHALRVTVTATNASGTTSSTSFPTEAVAALENTPPPPPVLDSSTNLNPVSGTILVKLPGSSSFTSVPTGTNVPIGSTVDAIDGTVSITVALPGGTTQTGEFYDGEFLLTQAKSGTTIPVLTGGSFSGCPAPGNSAAARINARAASSTKKKKKPNTVVRQLWGNAHGNYTTKGRYGSASVSGTIWLVQDRCDGTYITATKDNVIVVAYAHPNKKYNVKQGQHILILAPGF